MVGRGRCAKVESAGAHCKAQARSTSWATTDGPNKERRRIVKTGVHVTKVLLAPISLPPRLASLSLKYIFQVATSTVGAEGEGRNGRTWRAKRPQSEKGSKKAPDSHLRSRGIVAGSIRAESTTVVYKGLQFGVATPHHVHRFTAPQPGPAGIGEHLTAVIAICE